MKIKPKHTASDLTIFTEMTMLANKHNAINLAQGFPDYEIDSPLKKLLCKATENNFNQYAPLSGNPKLLQKIIEFNQNRKKPIHFELSQVTITPGATYGIYTALTAIVQPNDEVIIIEPAYDSYLPSVEMSGGVPVFVAYKENYEVDWEELRTKISEKTKAIIVNSPHNPSGKVWTAEEWEKLWQLIKETDILVISDEVYDLLTFDNTQFVSAYHHPKIAERCFVIYSFGKMFHITGWKIGYVVAPVELTKAFRRIHQYLTFCVNAPAQEALAAYFDYFDAENNLKMMQQKKDFFISEIKDLPFSIDFSTKGSYFQVLGYEKISSLRDKEFSYWLTENYKVATIPVSAFFHDGRNTDSVRFCFAKKEETILEAVKNLKKIGG